MPKIASTTTAPLAFDLAQGLYKDLEGFKKKFSARSVSAIVRLAIENYDVKSFKGEAKDHKQLSVRLPVPMKDALLAVAKKNKVSVGELIRAAIVNYNDAPVAPAVPAPKKAPAKKGRKPAAEKAVVKKAPGKKGRPKKDVAAPAKKAPAKKGRPAGKKTAAKKPAAKKAVVKKAPVRKVPGKKGRPKKAVAPAPVPAPKKRVPGKKGRPAAKKAVVKKAPVKKFAVKKTVVKKAPAKKGRPAKKAAAAPAPKKKRGRPAKK